LDEYNTFIRPIHKAHSVRFDYSAKLFVSNERFDVIQGAHHMNPDVPGDLLPVVGDERFSPEYWTVFGPCFAHKGISVRADDDGIRGCIRRITCKRSPEIPGLHEELCENQRIMRDVLGRDLTDYIKWFKNELSLVYNETADSEDMRNAWTDAPHPKRLLRQRARMQMFMDGRGHHPTRVKNVIYGPKRGEILPSKYLRGIGDLTTPGSTKGCYMIDSVKSVFKQRYVHPNGTLEFVGSPDKRKLSSVIEELHRPNGCYFVFFSDDSCVGIQCSDGIFTADVDISQCDGSNFYTFDVLKELMDHPMYQEDIDGMFKQLELPCEITLKCDIDKRKKRKIVLAPKGKILYSGSGLTTVTNNVANTLGGLNILRLLRPIHRRKVAHMEDVIVRAFHQVGFIVKVKVTKNACETQFLKHSSSREWDVYLNIGVWLRTFGMTHGDLPGRTRTPIAGRAYAYIRGVVESHIHDGYHAVSKAFRDRFAPEMIFVDADGEKLPYIPDEDICLRYGISQANLDELVEIILSSSIGTLSRCHAVDKIMEMDYGY
jgi:hypothetical protein